MNKNQTKNPNAIAGIIMLVIAIALILVDTFIFQQDIIKLLPAAAPLALCGLVLLFVRIKSYGYAIALSLMLMVVIKNCMETPIKTDSTITASIAAVVFLGLLIYKNVKK